MQPIYDSRLTGHPTITISTPLFDQDGQEIGELAANLNLERLDGIVLESTGLGSAGQMYLVEPGSTFVGQRLRTGALRGRRALTGDRPRPQGSERSRALQRLPRRAR